MIEYLEDDKTVDNYELVGESLVKVDMASDRQTARDILKSTQNSYLKNQITLRVDLAKSKKPSIVANLKLDQLKYKLGEAKVAEKKTNSFYVPLYIFALKK